MIKLENLFLKLAGRQILNGMNLHVREGETYVIIGRSGTGKSVTLKNIMGLMSPDEGNVEVMGQSLNTLDHGGFYDLRRKMGVLFQSGALLNWLSVGQNVALPLKEHNHKLTSTEANEIVREKLALVGLEGVEERMPSEISGGMKKRVGLARAIVHNPQVILYDEPTSGLDPVMSNQINDLITSLQKKLGVTSICVTHDMESAYRIADRIGMMHGGQIIEEGTPDDIRNTQNPYVRQFIEGHTEGPLTNSA